MDSKFETQPRPMGPHTAHTVFKIATGVLVALFYTITSYFGLSAALKISFAIYFAIPFVIRCSSWLQKSIIFMHNVWWPPSDPTYFTPAYHGVEGGRNFYVDPVTGREAKQGLGVWHILPGSLAAHAGVANEKNSAAEYWRKTLATSGKPIVMYFHGNMGSRATAHRIDVYRMLQSEQMLDSHVIAFDYTGFADCTQCVLPSESSVVHDAFTVYKWICDTVAAGAEAGAPRPKLYVWGHSLGTSISSHMVAKLQDPGTNFRKQLIGAKYIQPSGLVLEAPFTTMAETFRTFPLNMIYSFWPIFDWLFVLPLYNNDIAFETDSYLRDLNSVPVLIFHATADAVVSFTLGESLYKRVKVAREAAALALAPTSEYSSETDAPSSPATAAPICFCRLDDIHYELAHTFQYIHPKFPKAVREFYVKTSGAC